MLRNYCLLKMFRHERGKVIIRSRKPTHNTISSGSSSEPLQEEMQEETESAMTQNEGIMDALAELYY